MKLCGASLWLVLVLLLVAIDDTLDDFVNFFQEHVESSLDLDPWDPIFCHKRLLMTRGVGRMQCISLLWRI